MERLRFILSALKIELNDNGLFQFKKYILAMCAGMCFEYAYRGGSEVWYLPLVCGIIITIQLSIDSFFIRK